jgi:chorismate dehydratase
MPEIERIRIGCVPYLNAKPLIDWFHSADCDVEAEIIYAVPSELARQLETDALDVALVSTFELFKNPALSVIPDLSISADGPVKSVRLFSCVPLGRIRSVALDTSSLTSVALIKVLMKELYGLSPEWVMRPPDLGRMLSDCDAGLIIGDLKLFDTPATHVLDLGQAWKDLTGLPFVYAAWLARPGADTAALTHALTKAKAWGLERLSDLTVKWATNLSLPEDRVRDYFENVMQFNLDGNKLEALRRFQTHCMSDGLIERAGPIRVATGGADA